MENYQKVLDQMALFGIELRDKDLAQLPYKIDSGKRVTCGKGGKDWYKLYLYQPRTSSKKWVTGTFGTYRNGGDWCKVDVDWGELSDADRDRMLAEREAKKAAAAAVRAEEIANASADALTIWRKAVATVTTPYLERKQVIGETCRMLDESLTLRWPAKHKGEDDAVWTLPAGTLVLPLMRYDMPRAEAMRGVQFIKPDGAKIYLRQFDKPGCCIRLGEIDEETPLLLVVEGYATGGTARRATGRAWPVFVAMDAGNLAHVVPLLRELYPNARILILADDDYLTRNKRTGQLNNPGRTAAKAIARKTERCDFVWPVFKPTNRGPKDTDFNDLHVLEGLDAVSDQLSGVIQALTKHYG